MTTTIRAGIAVGLLAGFFAITLGIVGALAVLTVVALAHERAVAGKLGFFTVVLGIAVVTALWKVARARAEDPGGVEVTPEAAPALWGTVRELAAEVNTRPPDEIRLVPEVNAAVTEHARWLGLVGGRRYLLLGLPLVQAFTVGQLRSVLAHELGHYSHNHTRLGALSYRGRMAVITTIAHIGTRNAVGMLLMGYARLYLMVESAVSRRQELEADRASVAVAGRATAASALRELPAIAGMWDFYLNSYVGFGWQAGLAPAEVFGGFGQMLAARAASRASFAGPEGSATSRYDTHPPIPQRVAAIEAMPESPARPDPGAASLLLGNLAPLVATLEQRAVNREGRTVLPWPQYTVAAATADAEAGRTLLVRAAAELSGRPDADVSTALDLLAAERHGDLGRCLTQWLRMQPAEALVVVVTDTVRLAVAEAGVAGWRHSWTGPVEFVDRAGEPFLVGDRVRLAMNPSTVDEIRRWLLGLRPAGTPAPPPAVAVASVPVPPGGVAPAAPVGRAAPGTPAPAAPGHASSDESGLSVIGGLAGIRIGGRPHDLFITDQGFIVVPAGVAPAEPDGPQRLWHLARSAEPDTLARRYGFLPYREVADARVDSTEPLLARLMLRDGTTLEVSRPAPAATLTEECPTTMLEALATLARR